MTNWEWITSDKKRFAKIIDDDSLDFFNDVIMHWWCGQGKGCPYAIDGSCTRKNCGHIMEFCSLDITDAYLDAEHED